MIFVPEIYLGRFDVLLQSDPPLRHLSLSSRRSTEMLSLCSQKLALGNIEGSQL